MVKSIFHHIDISKSKKYRIDTTSPTKVNKIERTFRTFTSPSSAAAVVSRTKTEAKRLIFSKIEELKNLNKKAREEGNVIQSPFYNDEVNNPCIREQNLSARCTIENNADKTVCTDYIENYVLCVKFWDMVKMRRRMNSEYPLLPPPEEREFYKKFYFEEFKEIARQIMMKRKKFMGLE